MSNKDLSPEQIKNWRKILVGMVGPYALIMSEREIQMFRDKMQDRVNLLSDELEKESLE